MNKITWKELILFLLKERENGNIIEDKYVMIHNTETADEHYCDIIKINNRLVLGHNYDER